MESDQEGNRVFPRPVGLCWNLTEKAKEGVCNGEMLVKLGPSSLEQR